MSSRLLWLLVLGLVCGRADAHGVDHAVEIQVATTVTVSHSDGTPVAHAVAEIHAPDEEQPFLRSRTDAQGRVAFLPDRPGEWRITVGTPDGHGLNTTITVGDDDVPMVRDPDRPGGVFRGLGGLLVITLLTILLLRILRRPRPEA